MTNMKYGVRWIKFALKDPSMIFLMPSFHAGLHPLCSKCHSPGFSNQCQTKQCMENHEYLKLKASGLKNQRYIAMILINKVLIKLSGHKMLNIYCYERSKAYQLIIKSQKRLWGHIIRNSRSNALMNIDESLNRKFSVWWYQKSNMWWFDGSSSVYWKTSANLHSITPIIMKHIYQNIIV